MLMLDRNYNKLNSMKRKPFLFRHRLAFILLPVLITLAMLIPLRQARINPDLNAYLPEGIPAKQNLARIEGIFGKYEPVILFFETEDALAPATLERIRDMSMEINRMPEFEQVLSLFDVKNIRGEEGAMIVEPAVRYIPATPKEREQLREEIKGNEMAYGLIVSRDFHYTMLLANPAKDIADADAVSLLEAAAAKYPGTERVYFNGTPYLKREVQAKASRDLALLMPIGLLLMAGFLYFSFREKRGVLLPLAVVAMSIIAALGLLPLLGWELSIMAILVPVMMIAVANNYGVHLISRYQELNAHHPGWSMTAIVRHALQHLNAPIVLTGLTTIVGILGLAAHLMLPARQMGVVSALGIAFALGLSLSFVPALLSGMKKGRVQQSFVLERLTVVDKVLAWFGRITTRQPRRVVAIFAAFFFVAASGIALLQVSINHENMMPKDHALRVSTQIADKSLGGSKNVTLLWEGDIKDPGLLQRMEGFQQGLSAMPEVGNVISIATVLRQMSKALNDPGDPGYDRIPESKEAVAQYLELYAMSGDPADLERLVDFEYAHAAMNVQFRAGDLRSFRKVIGKVESLVSKDPNCTLMAGHALMEKELAEAVVRGQVYSLVFAGLAIALLMWLIFRSLAAAWMGSLPLVFALGCNFGLMGFLGLDLDIASSLLSSIAIGIGIDYTIHLFWRLRAELAGGADYVHAVRKTLGATGRGITINAISVMLGFSVLFLSALVLLKTFAFLMIFSLLLCLLCALVFIPALCMLLHPGFLARPHSFSHLKTASV